MFPHSLRRWIAAATLVLTAPSVHALQASGSAFGVFWPTYNPDGTPVWFMAYAPGEHRSYWGDLLSVSRPSGSPSEQSTKVGTLGVGFKDAQNAIVQWTLNGIPGFATVSFMDFDATPPAYDETGEWYDLAKAGWGIGVADQGDVRLTTLYTYDTSGNPVWANALFVGDQTVAQADTYYGPGLCPAGCAGNAPTPLPNPAGTITLPDVSLGALSFGAQLNQTSPVPLVLVLPPVALGKLIGQSP